MLSSDLFCGIYIAKEAHLSLKLASVKCQVPNLVFGNAKKIKTEKTTQLMINFFPVRSEHSLNWTLQICANILFETKKKKKKSSMEYS